MGYMGVGRGIQRRREGCAEGKGAPGSGRALFQLFLGGPKIFFIFHCHRTIEKLEKTALYM